MMAVLSQQLQPNLLSKIDDTDEPYTMCVYLETAPYRLQAEWDN